MTPYLINHLTLLFTDDQPHPLEEVQAYHDKTIGFCPDCIGVTIIFEPDNVALLQFKRRDPYLRIYREKF